MTTALLLGGCSYGYTLKADTHDGKVIFTPELSTSRRSQGRGCFANFTVKTKAGETVWEWGSDKYAPGPCQNLLPVTYGVAPAGLKEATRAKPLQLGVDYVIEAWDGDSYTGSFRLQRGIYAENLPYVSNILAEAGASSSR